MKPISALFKVVVIVLTVAVSASPSLAQNTVKLGINEVRSGAFTTNGDRVVWGVEAAVKEANEAGGLLGKKIELVIEDNQLKGEIAVQKLKKMILEDDCQIIIQGSSSGVGGAIAQQMPRYKRIYLCTNAEAMAITGENFTPYTFRTCLNAAQHVKALAKYFGGKGLKKPFLLNQDYSWGYDVAKHYEMVVTAYAKEAKVAGKEFHPIFNKDFGPYISKIQASGADYVLTGNWGTDMTQLIVQGRSLGMKIPIGSTFIDDDAVGAVAGDAYIGDVGANQYILGVDTPQAKAFEDGFFKSSGGKWPSFVAMEAYIGTKMYFEAVKKAKTFETEAVIKAFEGMTYEGPLGAITMRKEDHQAQSPVAVGEVVKKTKYYDFPYLKPIMIVPAAEVSATLEESGWKPYKE
ncbi:MAG: ABC transporter substrate-binding protein [Desulfobacterales bacterium]|nr:ABC transporter substrate-binding protein [Desulfobacterales bacterium]